MTAGQLSLDSECAPRAAFAPALRIPFHNEDIMADKNSDNGKQWTTGYSVSKGKIVTLPDGTLVSRTTSYGVSVSKPDKKDDETPDEPFIVGP